MFRNASSLPPIRGQTCFGRFPKPPRPSSTACRSQVSGLPDVKRQPMPRQLFTTQRSRVCRAKRSKYLAVGPVRRRWAVRLGWGMDGHGWMGEGMGS